MQADVGTVTETWITVRLTVDEARAAVNALSYFNLAVGGNNFEMGYHGEEGKEEARQHKMARSLQVLLDKSVTRAERTE